ncbi:hypothetical protein CRI77_14005 [Mycolicibacterium duvalii]|uniref:Uncharacterized protein n=1 Tax=Mycolicibacterium duvalii TaxID=39688 RepID=A0A7I7JVD0_9MYCO|nr:hypothetical protein [Mycolicibacterium duvalii]MCV7367049.1 hypothetical protein [Mycolicibacterium duvalii]PEG40350.1 hypothetical protein CRI77_14005 [Mycolicibacterium duvalii]BBX15827.1 hypothetical protein MDUV_06870 [Mycolicibacterium duvalii]
MGVRRALAQLAVRRAHVLIVEVPGHWSTRAALQRRLSTRGWREATAPADADVLAVCGAPGPELSELIDAVWEQLPGPRCRIDVAEASHVDAALDRATAELLGSAEQRRDARNRLQRPDLGDANEDHEDMDHEDMDHGDMEMAPEGIPLAQGDDDRDGLEMDVLHVRLGPVLSHWPAGLVLRCTLSGDVVTAADGWVVDGIARSPVAGAAGLNTAARQCDHLDDLFALAGMPRDAAAARRCRDLLLDEHGDDTAARLLSEMHRRVRRSRPLRWVLRDIAPLTADYLEARGLPADLAGDTHTRMLTRLRITAEHASHRTPATASTVEPQRLLEVLPEMVRGLDLATARLAVAGLGVETAVPAEAGAS